MCYETGLYLDVSVRQIDAVGERDCEFLKHFPKLRRCFISPKEKVRRGAYLSGLKATQHRTGKRPGLLTGKFGNALYKKRHHTYLHMRFDATRQAIMHWFQLQLGALEGAEAAFDDSQSLVCAGSIFRREGVILGLDDGTIIADPEWRT